MSAQKAEMQAWLTECGISWTIDMLKNELYDLVKKNKPEPEYVCERMALEKGFGVVHLPPYHCIFNSIELIWIKQNVAKENKTFKIANVFTLTNKAISAVRTCGAMCASAAKS